MSVADYAHWNEEAELVWWLEEGRHPYEPSDDYDNPDAGWEDEDEDEPNCIKCGSECTVWDDYCEKCEAANSKDAGDYAGPEDLGWDGGLEA